MKRVFIFENVAAARRKGQAFAKKHGPGSLLPAVRQGGGI